MMERSAIQSPARGDRGRRLAASGLILVMALTLLVALLTMSRGLPSGAGGNSGAPSSLEIDQPSSTEATDAQPAPAKQRSPSVAPPMPAQRSEPQGPAPEEAVSVPGEPASVTAALDRAMAALLKVAPTDPALLAEQAQNRALVLAVAGAADAMPDQSAADDAWAAILARSGRTVADLAPYAAQAGFTLDDFRAEFRRLYLADHYAQIRAAAMDITVAAYVAQLRQEADQEMAATSAAMDPAVSPAAETTRAEAQGVRPGDLAPAFALPALADHDRDHTLQALRGQPVLLSFWTTWCPYCLRQTPVLAQAAPRYAGSVHFLGINVREEREPVAAFVREQAVPYPVALDEDGAVAQRYQVSGYPTSYLLDADGRVVARHMGAFTQDDLARFLAQVAPDPSISHQP